MNTDRIEKQIEIIAPVSQVWQAVTNHEEFGAWFGVRLDGPFVPGQESSGQMTIPGYEHLQWKAVVETVEPERLFSFHWHPYAIDPEIDYSSEPATRVEFTFEATPAGTLLRVVESGFDQLPSERRDLAFRMNEGGWAAQIENIRQHVDAQH